MLVATDAIGMGLNLNIRRVVFHAITKSNGRQMRRLEVGPFPLPPGRPACFFLARRRI